MLTRLLVALLAVQSPCTQIEIDHCLDMNLVVETVDPAWDTLPRIAVTVTSRDKDHTVDRRSTNRAGIACFSVPGQTEYDITATAPGVRESANAESAGRIGRPHGTASRPEACGWNGEERAAPPRCCCGC
jgi:hypothetical protein